MWDAQVMKAGKHPEKALTAVAVNKATKPGRYADGNGLYLFIDQSGAKRWVLRTVVRGRRTDIGLGSVRLVPLAEAREKALIYRKLAREGGDPIAIRRREMIVVPTFSEAAEKVHAEHKAGWKNDKHAAQWLATLKEYAYPTFGTKRVDSIDTADVLKVLSPIWMTKPETARRVRQRIGTVLDWAHAAGHRAGENPVRTVNRGLPKQVDKKQASHFSALAWADVPKFMQQLRAMEVGEGTRLAFEFLILSVARTSEVLGATWVEIDLENKLWTIPASRMKAAKEHRVPLAPRCVEILQRAKVIGGGSEYIFPGRSLTKPLSNMVFLMTLRRMKLDITAHGFRSAFSDWASERTNFPHEVREAALAHTIKNRVEAAYGRGDLLDKRRDLMETWAAFATGAGGEVVQLRAGR
jgi:integrase